MESQARILLLEDDAGLHETVREYLEEHGYEVHSAYDGHEAQDLLYEKRFDLLLLDVNTPEIDGFRLLQEARAQGIETPAIYLTARESVEDLERGFRSGADDYLRKPFSLKELLLRVETLLKRTHRSSRSVEKIPIYEGVEYDPANRILHSPDGEQILGSKEGSLLLLFLRNPGQVLSHERIFSELWGYDEEPSDNSLRTYIKNLRRLIGKERIVSIKRQGYRYLASE